MVGIVLVGKLLWKLGIGKGVDTTAGLLITGAGVLGTGVLGTVVLGVVGGLGGGESSVGLMNAIEGRFLTFLIVTMNITNFTKNSMNTIPTKPPASIRWRS